MMRLVRISLITAVGLTTAVASASATPKLMVVGTPQSVSVVQVMGGCRWGWRPNRWGRCVPIRGFRGSRGFGPYRWHAPNDFIANDLNRRQLRGF